MGGPCTLYFLVDASVGCERERREGRERKGKGGENGERG